MSKERHHIDEYFRGLNDVEFTAPEDSWKNIESQLDKKRRGGIITIWTGLAAGLALLIGLGVYTKYISKDRHSIHSNQITNAFQNKTNSTPKILNSNTLTKQNSSTVQNKTSEPEKIMTNEIALSSKPAQYNTMTVNASVNKLTKNENEEINNNLTYNKNIAEATDEAPVATDKPAENKLTYLNPLSINLKTYAKPTLAVQKEIFTENNPAPQPETLFIAEVIPQAKKINHWSISGQVAPLYSYRNSEQPSGTTQKNDEKGLVAYAGGFKVDYKTSRRISIQTGVFYSVIGQTLNNVAGSSVATNYQGNVTPQASNVVYSTSNSMGPIVNKSNDSRNIEQLFVNPGNDISKTGPSANVITGVSAIQTPSPPATIVQELKFIEVPVLARFKLIDRKIGLHVLGGLSANFLLNSDVILKKGTSTENNWTTTDLNGINYSGTIGFGINYEFLRNFDLAIEPTYKYYLNSISTNSNFNYRPYAFGVYTGIVFKF
jgi:hypothetical protein